MQSEIPSLSFVFLLCTQRSLSELDQPWHLCICITLYDTVNFLRWSVLACAYGSAIGHYGGSSQRELTPVRVVYVFAQEAQPLHEIFEL